MIPFSVFITGMAFPLPVESYALFTSYGINNSGNPRDHKYPDGSAVFLDEKFIKPENYTNDNDN
jgi:hypothetical protein